MAFLAFDDTDSLEGGCTTHVAYRAIELLDGLDLIGAPLLVRLNPNVPFKTRGNGAVCLRVGHGAGPSRRVGLLPDGRDVRAFDGGSDPSERELDRAFRRLRTLVASTRRLATTTRPGLVAGTVAPPEAIYWRTVQELVPAPYARTWAQEFGTRWAQWNGGRGLLGAVAAAAWTGDQDGSWEAISYRHADQIGSRRRIDEQAVAAVDRRHPTCFDTWDEENAVARAVPASPCPVLHGVRGESRSEVIRAADELGPEDPVGWLAFWTNQATDDHVTARTDAYAPWSTHAVHATVARAAVTAPGGHVFVAVDDRRGLRLALAAYEPTKSFRNAVRRLRPDDTVVVVGGFHQDTSTLAMEKLVVLTAPDERPRSNPRCARCDRSMKSRGRDAGYRCRGCGAKTAAASTPSVRVTRHDALGAYEVPVCARRHLAKPLSRGGPLIGLN